MICLTFDTDHMDEAHMRDFLRRVRIPGAGTFFCTQRFQCLDGTEHEVGPHPAMTEGSDWTVELRRMKAMFPQARGWRSHSCIFSHPLADWVADNGYRYVSLFDQFGQKSVRPFRHIWGFWEFPIYYMDNLAFWNPSFLADQGNDPFSSRFIETAFEDDGVYVFDFHPIHLLMNTPNREYYFSRRDRFKAGQPLGDLVFDGEGSLSFFERLCAALQRHGEQSVSLNRALDLHLAKAGKLGG